MRTAEKVKNSECIIFGGGHFPTSEDPDKFKEVITPVLKKILRMIRNGEAARPRTGLPIGAVVGEDALRRRPAAEGD